MENACFRKTKMNKIHRRNAIELGNGHGHMAFVGLYDRVEWRIVRNSESGNYILKVENWINFYIF